MRRLLAALTLAAVFVLGSVVPAAAVPPTPGCNGLDVAHVKVHANPAASNANAPGGLLHDVRVHSATAPSAHHC